jgi:hypothetical protein
MQYADSNDATHSGLLHHHMLACATVRSRAGIPSMHRHLSPTTLMTATCTRCRRLRTPSCPTKMLCSITQTLYRGSAVITAPIFRHFALASTQAHHARRMRQNLGSCCTQLAATCLRAADTRVKRCSPPNVLGPGLGVVRCLRHLPHLNIGSGTSERSHLKPIIPVCYFAAVDTEWAGGGMSESAGFAAISNSGAACSESAGEMWWADFASPCPRPCWRTALSSCACAQWNIVS